MADPEWYDAQAAGWWVWGISQWIGTGWCPVDENISPRMPQVGAAGNGSPGANMRGVHRVSLAQQMPSISDGRVGGLNAYAPRLSRKKPNIGSPAPDRRQHGLGVHGRRLSQQMPSIGASDSGGQRKGIHTEAMQSALYDYFRALQARLRRARVVCGDFERILGPSVTWRHGMSAIFLDPPYADAEHAVTYAGGGNVWERVCRWCEENGDNPLLRIALCGYGDTWEAPPGWTAIRWKSSGGYGSQGNARGRENANRETVWFSPACLDPAELAKEAMTRPLQVKDTSYIGTMFEEKEI